MLNTEIYSSVQTFIYFWILWKIRSLRNNHFLQHVPIRNKHHTPIQQTDTYRSRLWVLVSLSKFSLRVVIREVHVGGQEGNSEGSCHELPGAWDVGHTTDAVDEAEADESEDEEHEG